MKGKTACETSELVLSNCSSLLFWMIQGHDECDVPCMKKSLARLSLEQVAYVIIKHLFVIENSNTSCTVWMLPLRSVCPKQ